ncbi:hypothetical protein L0F63_005975 [Massospora cicadina]|nr:hypothetical protein L0F63_005975 [Massospora cicadina]
MIKFGPNTLIGRLLASAVDALTQKTDLELIQQSWDQFLLTYNSLDKARVETTSIPKTLANILDLIQKDERTRLANASDLSCLDYFIQERALVVLVDYALQDAPRGLRLEVARFFSSLVTRHPGRILPHLSARRPLLRLVRCFLSAPEECSLAKEAHINLLLSISTTLNRNSDLLGLFTASPTVHTKRPTSLSEPIALNLANTVVKVGRRKFDLPLTYAGNLGSMGAQARGALLELIHLLSSDSSNLLLSDSTFCDILFSKLGQLKALFKTMPTNFSLESNSNASAHVDLFFELWRFTNEPMPTTPRLCPKISRWVLDSVVVPFVDDVRELLSTSSTPLLCSRLIYYLEMLQTTHSHEVQVALLSLLLDEVAWTLNGANFIEPPRSANFAHPKISAEDEEASMVCLQVFDTLISLHHPIVYQTLLPGLFSASYGGPLPYEPLAYRLLGLLKPTKLDLRQDLKEFLQLLNPPSHGHEGYFVECLDSLDKADSIQVSLRSQVPPEGEVRLPALLQALIGELHVISSRRHERILLISGILLKLMSLPSSRLMSNDSNSPHPGFIDRLIGLLHKAPNHLRCRVPFPRPADPLYIHDGATYSAAPSNLDGNSAVVSRPSQPLETSTVLYSPCESLLVYVSEAHRPLFMSYVALQEVCKELAAFLTVFRFNAATRPEAP